jgi:hypothetical protein
MSLNIGRKGCMMTSVRSAKIRDNRPPLQRAVARLTTMRKHPASLAPEVAEVFAAIEANDTYRRTMLTRALDHLETFVTRGTFERAVLLDAYRPWADWYAHSKMNVDSLRRWFEADASRECYLDAADDDAAILQRAYAREAMSIYQLCLDLAQMLAEEQRAA